LCADPPFQHSFPTRRSSDLRRWIIASAVMLAVFAVAVVLSALSLGIRLPGREPRSLAVAAGFDPNEGWIRQLGPQRYEVNLFAQDRKSTRLNSSHVKISYAV